MRCPIEPEQEASVARTGHVAQLVEDVVERLRRARQSWRGVIDVNDRWTGGAKQRLGLAD